MATTVIESFESAGRQGVDSPRRLQPGDLVEYPDAVRVGDCPAVGHKQVKLDRCRRCEHSVGLTEPFPSDNLPFHKRFRIGCRFPVGRALVLLAGDDE